MVTLVLAQAAQIAVSTEHVAAMEARLGLPPKTPNNSSLPPSKGQKPSLPSMPKREARPHPVLSTRHSTMRRMAEPLAPSAHRLLHPEPTRHRDVRAMLPCAVHRKITDGFRQEWGAYLYADIRSVIGTVRRRSIRHIDAIRLALNGEPLGPSEPASA